MLPEVEGVRVQTFVASKKLYPQGRSHTSVHQSSIARHTFMHAPYTCIISPKHGNGFNTRSNGFTRRYIEHVTSCKRKNHFVSCCEG